MLAGRGREESELGNRKRLGDSLRRVVGHRRRVVGTWWARE